MKPLVCKSVQYPRTDGRICSGRYKLKIACVSRKDCDELSNTIVGWDSIENKKFQKALMEKMDKGSSLVSEHATTLYLMFLEKFPTVANRGMFSYIEPYLGITQSLLGRIIKNIR